MWILGCKKTVSCHKRRLKLLVSRGNFLFHGELPTSLRKDEITSVYSLRSPFPHIFPLYSLFPSSSKLKKAKDPEIKTSIHICRSRILLWCDL